MSEQIFCQQFLLLPYRAVWTSGLNSIFGAIFHGKSNERRSELKKAPYFKKKLSQKSWFKTIYQVFFILNINQNFKKYQKCKQNSGSWPNIQRWVKKIASISVSVTKTCKY